MSADEKKPAPPAEDWDQTGLCEEAQADGIPCFELGRQCETCERAKPPIPPPPAKPAGER